MMAIVTTWLITREADDARSERDVLDARGLAVIEVPCVETTFHPWPWFDANAALTLFTSKRAVEAWKRAGKPTLHEVAAIAPTTARTLEAEGVTVQTKIDGGAVALAEGIKAFTHARYPTSSAGLASREQVEAMRVLEAKGSVDRRVVYDVSPPQNLKASLVLATQLSWSATFSSPSAVRHFLDALDPGRPPVRVICLGKSTARAWDEARPDQWPVAIHSRDLRSTLEEVIS